MEQLERGLESNMEKEKILEKARKEAEDDYDGGGAYRAFLEMFYKNKIEEDKKNEQTDSKTIQNKMYYEKMQRKEQMGSASKNVL